ncbi:MULTISPECIES: hypothetical protein [Bacillaceae]|uniref:hypothetical protein n=1 Tax=Bacillaceae TaxID=186817 RepID=UPI001E4AF7DF|nr:MULTISPECIES: hypothetical protein [Bacillaceae]MCE4048176.1 hypothetical protein [Bacillus sp. Au-Bac7]MCM3033384.1 hypothetical protein [Niallia sp. MER 6]MDL0434305.1 hypothetical protein [Niallia sp. SS-2023]UPO89054.1 hypothetical protein L8T27_007860 [Niallia sp. Man26]
MVNLNDAKRRLMIQKLAVYGNYSFDALNSFSLPELNKRYHECMAAVHPHDGTGSIKWKKQR